MAMSIALLRAAIADFPDRPARVCEVVSRQLHEYAGGGQFVSVFLGVLDPGSGLMTYSNAGQNPPVLLSSACPEGLLLLKNTGMALGVDETEGWQTRQARLERGDALILYSDGITEAENVEYEFYEMRRLVQVARENAGRPALAIRNAILDSVQQFMAGAEQSDDIALLVIARQ
jgi:sigma-B regulation protein RsbU (phosphoserine phosphatase)